VHGIEADNDAGANRGAATREDTENEYNENQHKEDNSEVASVRGTQADVLRCHACARCS